MRRSIVPPPLLLATAAAATAALAAILVLAIAGSATAAASSSPHIACPVTSQTCCPLPPGAKSSRVVPVCCGTPVCCANTPCCVGATCCPAPAPGTCCPPTAAGTCCTPTPCPTSSITITATPNPSTAGHKVVISGAVMVAPVGGTPVAAAQVVLWRELAGHSSFQQIAQTTTDGAGRYSFTLQPGSVMADQSWYVTSNGMQSSTVRQQVAAVVALASSTRSALVGQAVALHGHVTPSHAGQVVLVEIRRGAMWRVIARPRLGLSSSYSVSRRFVVAGVDALRVVLPGDSRNARSTSRTLTVTVRP